MLKSFTTILVLFLALIHNIKSFCYCTYILHILGSPKKFRMVPTYLKVFLRSLKDIGRGEGDWERGLIIGNNFMPQNNNWEVLTIKTAGRACHISPLTYPVCQILSFKFSVCVVCFSQSHQSQFSCLSWNQERTPSLANHLSLLTSRNLLPAINHPAFHHHH